MNNEIEYKVLQSSFHPSLSYFHYEIKQVKILEIVFLGNKMFIHISILLIKSFCLRVKFSRFIYEFRGIV